MLLECGLIDRMVFLIEKINELTKENIQLKSQLQIANEKESMQKLTVEKIKQIQTLIQKT